MNALPLEIDLGERLFKDLVPQHKNMAIRYYNEFPEFEDFAREFGGRIWMVREDFHEVWKHREIPNSYSDEPLILGRAEQLTKQECQHLKIALSPEGETGYCRITEVATRGLKGSQVEPISLVYYVLQAELPTSVAEGSRQGLLEGLKARLSQLDTSDINQKHKIRDYSRSINHLLREAEDEDREVIVKDNLFCETDNWYTELEGLLSERALQKMESGAKVRQEMEDVERWRRSWSPEKHNAEIQRQREIEAERRAQYFHEEKVPLMRKILNFVTLKSL